MIQERDYYLSLRALITYIEWSIAARGLDDKEMVCVLCEEFCKFMALRTAAFVL